jgi:transposase
MKKTTNFSSEFKREAVKLAQSTDKPTSLIAKELGIKANTLYNWISKAMKKQKPLAKAKQPASHRYKELEQANKRLEKELKRVQMERDILKKAAAYFASQEL